VLSLAKGPPRWWRGEFGLTWISSVYSELREGGLPHHESKAVTMKTRSQSPVAPPVLIALLALAGPARAQCALDKLTSTSPVQSGHFGRSVNIEGNTLVVGASMADGPVPDTGAVEIYENGPQGWTLTAKLTPFDGIAGDTFGYSTCLAGDVLLVGAPFADSLAQDAGAVYAYERGGSAWIFKGKLAPPGIGANDRFGFCTALRGTTLFVSSHKDDDLGTDAGAVYHYELNAGAWTLVGKFYASDAQPGDDFGESIAISGDRAIISTWSNADLGPLAGAVYFFEETPSGWTEVQKVHASDGAALNQYGAAVALEGSVAVVGSRLHVHAGVKGGAVYVYEHNGASWVETAELLAGDGQLGDEFGHGVAISSGRILVGGPFADPHGVDSGAAWVFGKSAGIWTELAKFTAQDGAALDRLGLSVSISGDLATAGALLDDDHFANAGSAYLWSISGVNCPLLHAVPTVLSASAGGTQHFALESGAAHAGKPRLLLGSAAGTTPGLSVDGLLLPLNPDGYFSFALANPNQPPLSGSLGVLGALGSSQAQLQLPSGLGALAGMTLHHAYVVLDTATLALVLASNAEALALTP
jgi:FG-GAP repeat